jgi:hypothetical protein
MSGISLCVGFEKPIEVKRNRFKAARSAVYLVLRLVFDAAMRFDGRKRTAKGH